MKEYEQKKQYFMNEEVIIIETYRYDLSYKQNHWIPIQHFFKGLDRLRSDGQVQGPDKDKLIEFVVNDLQVEGAVKSFNITSEVDNTTSARHTQDMNCIRLDVLALAVTQFKPTGRKGTRALLIWRAYMRFLNNLLNDYEVQQLLITQEKCEDLEGQINNASKYMIKGRTLNDVVAATGQNRCKIESYCLNQNWYCKHNNDVGIIRNDLVIRTRKGAVEFTEKGMEILLEVFKRTQKTLF